MCPFTLTGAVGSWFYKEKKSFCVIIPEDLCLSARYSVLILSCEVPFESDISRVVLNDERWTMNNEQKRL